MAIRNLRRDGLKELGDLEKDKAISEDEFYQAKEDLQALTDQYIKKADELGEAKQAEDNGSLMSQAHSAPDPALLRARQGAPPHCHHHGWQWAVGPGSWAATHGPGTAPASRICARCFRPPPISASRW